MNIFSLQRHHFEEEAEEVSHPATLATGNFVIMTIMVPLHMVHVADIMTMTIIICYLPTRVHHLLIILPQSIIEVEEEEIFEGGEGAEEAFIITILILTLISTTSISVLIIIMVLWLIKTLLIWKNWIGLMRNTLKVSLPKTKDLAMMTIDPPIISQLYFDLLIYLINYMFN